MSGNTAVNELAEVLPRMIRTAGQLYMDATKILVEDFGAEGERSVRRWLRRWGQWRGHELRKGHMALGLPINMESLAKNWDSAAATYHLMETWEKEGEWDPGNVRVPVHACDGGCPISEPWRDNDFWLWGHVLCDEFHIQFVSGYHPDAVVVIPECIMKRDPTCTFHFVMPANAKEAEAIEAYPGQDVIKDWQRGTEEEAILSGLRRKSRITAARIYYLWEILAEFHPQEADATFKKIIDKWVENRSLMFKKEEGDTSPENLFKNLDHPYGISWETKTNVDSDGIDIEVSYCPFAETWNWLGGLSAMNNYCERCYSGLASNYDDSFSAEILQCKTRGDDVCRIKIKGKIS